MSFEYLLILLGLTIIPFCLQIYYKVELFSNLRHALVFSIIIAIVGIVWDNFAVYRGHWFYPGKGIIGIFIGYIPLEDYLFIFVTAYFMLVFYRVTEKLK